MGAGEAVNSAETLKAPVKAGRVADARAAQEISSEPFWRRVIAGGVCGGKVSLLVCFGDCCWLWTGPVARYNCAFLVV